ncbi:hypothetical protein GCM10009682_09630 [Luedemannella flava]|uniref:Uncharacterized protein n=1 Tax=Luedemannella flava TaxID=349316 RepID=A0ABN2LIA6_9ACTN
MTAPHVLFVATGGDRHLGVWTESRRVVTGGGRALVLLDHADAWPGKPLHRRVKVVETSKLEKRHWPRRAANLVLFRGPAWLLRAVGRGRLADPAGRMLTAYQDQVASRVQRLVVLPVYRALSRTSRARLINRHVLSKGPFDAVVVSDPHGLRDVAALVRANPDVFHGTRVSFGLAYDSEVGPDPHQAVNRDGR